MPSSKPRWIISRWTYQHTRINPMALAKKARLMRYTAGDGLRLTGQAVIVKEVEGST